MKKIVLCIVFVFAVAIQMNANTDIEKKEKTTKEVSTEVEVPGCASDCVSAAREGALLLSEDHTDRGPEGELMQNYNMLYQSCYDANCA